MKERFRYYTTLLHLCLKEGQHAFFILSRCGLCTCVRAAGEAAIYHAVHIVEGAITEKRVCVSAQISKQEKENNMRAKMVSVQSTRVYYGCLLYGCVGSSSIFHLEQTTPIYGHTKTRGTTHQHTQNTTTVASNIELLSFLSISGSASLYSIQ